jgi:hypothetical protein
MNFAQMMPLMGMAGGAALAPFTGGMSALPMMMGAGGMLGGAGQQAMGGGQQMPPPPPAAPPPFQPKGPSTADNAMQAMTQMMQNRPKSPFGAGGGF